MRKYQDFNTGEFFTEEEIREQFEMFRDELVDEEGKPKYSNFDEYMDQMLKLGNYREGGYIEA